jgi:hypothetical protein
MCQVCSVYNKATAKSKHDFRSTYILQTEPTSLSLFSFCSSCEIIETLSERSYDKKLITQGCRKIQTVRCMQEAIKSQSNVSKKKILWHIRHNFGDE